MTEPTALNAFWFSKCDANQGGSFFMLGAVDMISPLKHPLTVDEQVELLKSRGLILKYENYAKQILFDENYYRFINAYSLGLYEDTSEFEIKYKNGVTFEQLHDLYQFDSRLRHIVSELLERFEIQFRSRMCYYLANKYCATCYMRPELFNNQDYHKELLRAIDREKAQQASSLIIRHHNDVYNGILPLWALIEVLSFGSISKFYCNLNKNDQEEISSYYHTNSYYLKSWVKSFVEVRNICAHYGRLYNRSLMRPPKLYKSIRNVNNKLVYSVFHLLIMNINNPEMVMRCCTSLRADFALHASANCEEIGAPDNWYDEAIKFAVVC